METKTIIKYVNITRIENDKKSLKEDYIIDEDILNIYINGEKSFQMVFSMPNPNALAAGFLFTQGIVKKKTDIHKISFLNKEKQCHIQLNNLASIRLDTFLKESQIKGSSGGILLKNHLEPVNINSASKDAFSITHKQVLSLIQMHQEHSRVFQQTGAVHSAGLCSPSKILFYYEDIGRHNAIDKLAGAILLKDIDTTKKIATLSCRMSLEIIGKIIKTGIPIVISNAAPTLCAVKLANEAGLTMIGFARKNRFNIYTHEKRIDIPATI